MDISKILYNIEQTLEQEDLSSENRIALEWVLKEIRKSKTKGEIKKVLINFGKFFIGNYDSFMDFFT